LAVGISKGDEQGGYQLWDIATGSMRATLSRQTGAVFALCFSPDGRLLATGERDGTVRVWDAAGVARAMPGLDRHRIWQLAFSPDGQTLACGTYWSVTLWDVGTGRPRGPITGRAPLAFAPDGRTLAAVRTDGPGVRLWDVGTGAPHAAPPGEAPPLQSLVLREASGVLAYAPDWGTLVTGQGGRTAFLWDVAGPRRVTLAGHEEMINAAAFAPDGRTVATASNDRTVKVWDAATGKLRATLRGHEGAVYVVAFSPDGRWLASGGFDQTVRLWELAPGTP
jgi:WD40 repeat protein